jgi:hypothetical protein
MSTLDLDHYVGPDEGEMVENTLEMMKTSYFHQRHPGYPGLLFYLQMIPATTHLLGAKASGEGSSIRGLPRVGFYRAIRRFTLLAGWFSAIVAFLIGRRWLGMAPAALAGSLVALSPLVLRESGVVNPDLLLMLFVAVGLWHCLGIVEKPDTARFVKAGIWVGLATAIKYTGAVLVAPYAVAWLCCGGVRRTFRRAALGAGLTAVAFVVASPYTLLDLPNTIRGLGMHVGYYQAADMNVPAELSRILASSGLGLTAVVAASFGSIWVMTRLERQGLVVLSFPMAYFFLFSFFERAYPRHVLVLVPAAALLAARAVRACFEQRARWLSFAVFAALLLQPLWDAVKLGIAAQRPTPAVRSAEWVAANLPPGSRILEDQFTPRVDPTRFHVHRLRVEEKVFAGDYDYVMHSGYPPGLPTRGLRPVARFEPDGSLGNGITLYQVPDREILMGVTFPRNRSRVVLKAGELPFFGEGWRPPRGGAFGTSRLSTGTDSEVFFVLDDEPPEALEVALRGARVGSDAETIGVRAELNGLSVAEFELIDEEPKDYVFSLPSAAVRTGLNRLVLHFEETVRLNRRHREAALAFYSLTLKRMLP